MSTLVVESPGMLTTVQDLGRMGLGTWGVSPSGAADPVAMRLGNLLVGNPEGAAVLEMTSGVAPVLNSPATTSPDGSVLAKICRAGVSAIRIDLVMILGDPRSSDRSRPVGQASA